MAVRVLVVDDQPPFGVAATAIVEATDDFEVVGRVDTGEADEYGPRAAEAGAAGYITRSEFSPDALDSARATATHAPAAGS